MKNKILLACALSTTAGCALLEALGQPAVQQQAEEVLKATGSGNAVSIVYEAGKLIGSIYSSYLLVNLRRDRARRQRGEPVGKAKPAS